jgi:hypothetical protein
VLDIPTDFSRPAKMTFQGSAVLSQAFRAAQQAGKRRGSWRRCTQVPTNVLRELRSLARSEGTTLYTILMAAYAVVLHRYSGQEDIIVGAPMARCAARCVL